MQKREVTFCKWFIVCTKHGLECPMKKGVEPNHRTLKAEVLDDGMIFGEPAFYFKYGGGLKPSNLKLHYPEDHGFKLIPLPQRLKPEKDHGGLYKLDGAGEAKVREFLGETQRNGGYYVTDQTRPRQVSSDDSSDEIVKRKTEMNDNENEAVDDNQETEFGNDSDNADEDGEDDDIEDLDYERPTIKKVKFEDSKIQEIVYHKEDTGQREEEEEEKGEDRAKEGDNQIQINLGATFAKNKTDQRKPAPEKRKTFDDFFSKKSRPKRKCKKVRQVDTEGQSKEAIKHLFTEVRNLKGKLVEIQTEQLATNQTLFDLAKATSDIRKQTQEKIAYMNTPLQVQVASQPGVLNRIIKKTLPEAENI